MQPTTTVAANAPRIIRLADEGMAAQYRERGRWLNLFEADGRFLGPVGSAATIDDVVREVIQARSLVHGTLRIERLTDELEDQVAVVLGQVLERYRDTVDAHVEAIDTHDLTLHVERHPLDVEDDPNTLPDSQRERPSKPHA